MTPQHAGRLINAFEITANLKNLLGSEGEPIGFTSPTSETHVRPLTKLSKSEDRATVWQRVVDTANGSNSDDFGNSCNYQSHYVNV